MADLRSLQFSLGSQLLDDGEGLSVSLLHPPPLSFLGVGLCCHSRVVVPSPPDRTGDNIHGPLRQYQGWNSPLHMGSYSVLSPILDPLL